MGKMTSKVFGIGLSRTGTSALNSILTQLGFDTRHYVGELMSSADWSVIEKHDAFCDSPIPLVYQECDERFPDSKFILTTRHKEAWLPSMKWLMSDAKVLWNFSNDTNEYHKAMYGCSNYNEIVLNKRWTEFHNEVYKYFSNRNLHVINIEEEGFDIEKLCEFLEIPFKQVSLLGKNSSGRKPSLYQKIQYFGIGGTVRLGARIKRNFVNGK